MNSKIYRMLLALYFLGCAVSFQGYAECKTSLNDVQQALSTYLFLVRYNSPSRPTDFFKNDAPGSAMIRQLDATLSKEIFKDIQLSMAFNNNVYILQEQNTQATVGMNKAWRPARPYSAAFILANTYGHEDEIILLLSTLSPVSIKILAFDKCFNVSTVINSRTPSYKGYFFEEPLQKIEVTANDVRLYEQDSPSYHLLSEIIALNKK
ncbi:hypothetical protein ACKXMA_002084 [Escherichia albertii]